MWPRGSPPLTHGAILPRTVIRLRTFRTHGTVGSCYQELAQGGMPAKGGSTGGPQPTQPREGCLPREGLQEDPSRPNTGNGTPTKGGTKWDPKPREEPIPREGSQGPLKPILGRGPFPPKVHQGSIPSPTNVSLTQVHYS